MRPVLRNDPLGMRSFRANMAARQKGDLPGHLMRAMDAVGPNAHTVEQQFLMNKVITTRDPENIKAVLSTQHSDWNLGPARGSLNMKVMGENILTHEGQAWKESRAMVRPQFYLSQITDTSLFEKHVGALFLVMKADKEGWTPKLEPFPVFHDLTLDVATEFLFHYSVHSQNRAARSELPEVEGRTIPDLDKFGPALDQATDWVGRVSPMGKWHWIVPSGQFLRNTKIVQELAIWFAHAALQQKLALTKPEGDKQHYYFLKEMSEFTQDPVRLGHEVTGLLFAARTTTAALLSWVFVYLARQPVLYDKLRAAIDEAIGLDHTAPIADMSVLRKCDYLQNCINEGLRLGTPTPFTSREAKQDTTLPTGGGEDGSAPIFVPKGTMIALSFFALHHRSDLYGDDVEEFKPERWENREKGWEMIAFGGGPRACVGRRRSEYPPPSRVQADNSVPEQFALNEASFAIARIVQRYDKIENLDPCKEIKYDMRFTNRPGTGVQVRFHEAKASG
ncbi:MAG: hypothetical protein Q9218_003608 [Villophora microphyllina]